jgi:hypothetical protein
MLLSWSDADWHPPILAFRTGRSFSGGVGGIGRATG